MDWIIFYHYISRQGIKFITSPNKTTDHLDMRPSIDGTETDVPILLPIHISFFRPDPKTRDLKSLVVWRSQKPIQSQTPLFLEGPMILRESGSQTNWLQVNQTNNQPTNQTNNQTNKQTNSFNLSNVSGHFCFSKNIDQTIPSRMPARCKDHHLRVETCWSPCCVSPNDS